MVVKIGVRNKGLILLVLHNLIKDGFIPDYTAMGSNKIPRGCLYLGLGAGVNSNPKKCWQT
jgi:hypothetical protein